MIPKENLKKTKEEVWIGCRWEVRATRSVVVVVENESGPEVEMNLLGRWSVGEEFVPDNWISLALLFSSSSLEVVVVYII